MPSFDIVSEVNSHELDNAIDQANRELATRFDFKGVDADFTRKEYVVTLRAPDASQVSQMHDILMVRMVKRGLDIKCVESKDLEKNLAQAKQELTIKQGVDKEAAKKIVKLIKDSKCKVTAAIQGEQIRVTGKNRDDLQEVMAMLRNAELDLPLQYTNFRD